MQPEYVKEAARFAAIMAAGMACVWMFVKVMSLAAYLDSSL